MRGAIDLPLEFDMMGDVGCAVTLGRPVGSDTPRVLPKGGRGAQRCLSPFSPEGLDPMRTLQSRQDELMIARPKGGILMETKG